jgi:outer membrane translocation and assembly module TamA
VPATERFFAGGAESQRGFSERQMSPSITGDVMGNTVTIPFGGTGLLETGVEARIPLTTLRGMPLGGVVFLDGGDNEEKPSQLNFARLNWAPGLGLRLKTAIGPVRFDVGYRVNRTGPMDPAPGSPFAFHLSLGEAF